MKTLEAHTPPETDQHSYTVDALINRMGVKANSALWNSIDSIIRVQGIVGKVNIYTDVVYFELRGAESKLTVKCRADTSPKEGDYVIVEGMPSFRPSRFSIGLEIIIDGVPVSQLDVKDADTSAALPNIEKARYLRLYDYLQSHFIDDLFVLGTETAIRDVVSHLDTSIAQRLSSQVMRVSDKSDIFAKINAMPNDMSALIIVRGGDDATLEIWNDREVIEALIQLNIPFYLALGHTHGMTLAARYADETFHTPSAFGSALGSIVRQVEQERILALRAEEFIKQQKVFSEREKSFNEREKIFIERAKQFENSEKLFLNNEKTLKEKEALLVKNLEEKDKSFQEKLIEKERDMQTALVEKHIQVSHEFQRTQRLYQVALIVLSVVFIAAPLCQAICRATLFNH